MEEYEIIELLDTNFNHVVHHYDLEYEELYETMYEKGTLDFHYECYGEVYWDEQ